MRGGGRFIFRDLVLRIVFENKLNYESMFYEKASLENLLIRIYYSLTLERNR